MKNKNKKFDIEVKDKIILIEGIEVIKNETDIIIHSKNQMKCVSCASIAGGKVMTNHILNHTVPLKFSKDDFDKLPNEIQKTYDLPENTVIFLTAVSMNNAVIVETKINGIKIILVVSAGTSNASSPKDPNYNLYREKHSDDDKIETGTINTILLIDAIIPDYILMNYFILLTECKVSVLFDQKIKTKYKEKATGTTTDAIAVVSTERGNQIKSFGLATEFGYEIAQIYQKALSEALENWRSM